MATIVSSRYVSLLAAGDVAGVVDCFETTPHLDVPRAGHLYGEDQVAGYVAQQGEWLAERKARVEVVAETINDNRTVSEFLLHLEIDGVTTALPVAVVGERVGGRPRCLVNTGLVPPVLEREEASTSVMHLRVYFSTWPLTGSHEQRAALLYEHEGLVIPDVVGEYQAALAAGDVDAVVASFEEDGYAREPSGAGFAHHGHEALRELYGHFFSHGGGIPLEHCTLTDDGTRSAIEYNVVRWGKTELPREPGVAVYERGRTGRLAAARIYDDTDPPLG